MFILIAIVVNCIMMAMNAPLPGEDKSQMNNSLVSANLFFARKLSRFLKITTFR